jgi:NADH-quinone oxidoreductase subunit H
MQILWSLFGVIIAIIAVITAVMFMVAAYTYSERKIIGFMQNRLGPNRVGYQGVLQPFADIMKLLLKEIIIPTEANKCLFIMAPIFLLALSLASWAVIPFSDDLVIANINVGILYILVMASLNIYGIIIAGWASNSKYAFLGALRAVAQILAYELAMGFAIIGVIMLAGSMNLTDIVLHQSGGIHAWHCWTLFPLMVIYFISAIAETNRLPFDVAEGESELVAGFHVEYSGVLFAMFFMAEYANMILVSLLTVLMFFGGWLSPFEGISLLQQYLFWIPGIFWLFAKAAFFMFAFLWMRATLPRYRYDHIMRLGWKIFIPITIGFIFIESIGIKLEIIG